MVESYISELLPAKYIKRHQLMLYLYDILVDILVKADKYKLSSLSFKFTNEVDEQLELFDELERRKDRDISEKVFIPHIFFSILRDLNYYLFESLSCIERGKVTVAFSLARKPLQDNLFYLSWILVQPHEFLGKMQYGSPKDEKAILFCTDFIKCFFLNVIIYQIFRRTFKKELGILADEMIMEW